MQKLWNLWSHYRDIYDWISPLNKVSDQWFILTQQFGGGGGDEYGKSAHFSILISLEHLTLIRLGYFGG